MSKPNPHSFFFSRKVEEGFSTTSANNDLFGPPRRKHGEQRKGYLLAYDKLQTLHWRHAHQLIPFNSRATYRFASPSVTKNVHTALKLLLLRTCQAALNVDILTPKHGLPCECDGRRVFLEITPLDDRLHETALLSPDS